MNIKIINILGFALFWLLVIINFDTAASIKCHVCQSGKNGDCWILPEDKYLKECGNENPDSTTEVPDSTPTSPPTTLTSPMTITQGTTPTTTQVTTPTTTQGTTPTTTQEETPSTPQGPTTSTTQGATPTTTQGPTPTTTQGTTPTTTQEETPSTPQGPTTSTTQGATPTTTQVMTPTTTQNSSESTTKPPRLRNVENLGRRRDAVLRADDSGYKCAKVIYKKGEEDWVERKCILNTIKEPCEKEKGNRTNVSVCDICDSEGCNTSSNISFGLISMIVPIITVFSMSF